MKKAIRNRKKSLDDAMKWYQDSRSTYIRLCNDIKLLIENLLKKNSIDYQSITCRAKEIDSFVKKCGKNKYFNPKDEIMDMAGIRIITYINSDVEKIGRIIEREFEIDARNSINKTQLLGTNQVGYRSVHYVAKLAAKRLELAEYEEYKDKVFEIQIRTILQHAWAEIEHDRNYKFSGVLPDEIKRRFNLAAGVLELIDREFESLSKEIDGYIKEVEQQTKKGQLDISINSTSLIEYLSKKYNSPMIEKTLGDNDEVVINELKIMGIETLFQLEQVLPPDLLANIINCRVERTTFLGLLRDVMIISNYEKYFNYAWLRSWTGFSADDDAFFQKYGISIESIAEKYDLTVDYLQDTGFYFDDDEYRVDIP